MVKRPSFQFYPGDWRGNAKLGRCTRSSRSAWLDIMSVLHDSDEYGVARWPLADLARAANVPIKLAQELATKDVLKGSDASPKPYIFTPFHAGKHGEPVVLVPVKDGEPCWYCSRLVRDEWVRQRRGAGTRFDVDNQPETRSPKSTPTRTIGERQGDGPSSSSSSEEERNKEKVVTATLVRVADRKAGSRWPADAVVPEKWKEEALEKRAQLHLASIDLNLTAEVFANYWASKSGRDATKIDWHRTWINWCLNTKGQQNGKGPSAHDKFFAAAATLIRNELDDGSSGQGVGDVDAGALGRPLLPR